MIRIVLDVETELHGDMLLGLKEQIAMELERHGVVQVVEVRDLDPPRQLRIGGGNEK